MLCVRPADLGTTGVERATGGAAQCGCLNTQLTSISLAMPGSQGHRDGSWLHVDLVELEGVRGRFLDMARPEHALGL